MQELQDALTTKFLDSTPYNDVGGRVFFRKATSDEYPRIVYSVITTTPDNVFARKGEAVLLQVDIFTADSAGDALMNTIDKDTRALLDDWRITIAGYGTLEFTWQNTVPLSEDIAVPDGTMGVNHHALDYEISFQAA